MAKSDSFFIRARVQDLNGGVFAQTSVDLGAYVDALGKSVLRIHRVSVAYNFAGTWGSPTVALGGPGTEARCHWQLTTQSQSDVISTVDKSVISSGSLDATNDTANPNAFSFATDRMDIAPQDFEKGYLVGVEQIYLGAKGNNFSTDLDVEIVMECTVETLSQSAAMALALSQQ